MKHAWRRDSIICLSQGPYVLVISGIDTVIEYSFAISYTNVGFGLR